MKPKILLNDDNILNIMDIKINSLMLFVPLS
jgi:hypothetical protein